MKKDITLISVGASCTATFMVLLCYKYAFPAGLVYDRADWGTFGDFFGGLLNPFIGIINIYLLAHISKAVDARDETRHEKSLAIQKQVALYELRHKALTEAVKIINDIYGEATKPKDAMDSKISEYRNELLGFFTVHSYLIKAFKDAGDHFFTPIQQLLNNSNQRFYDRRNNTGRAAALEKELGELLSNLLDLRDKLVSDAQKELDI